MERMIYRVKSDEQVKKFLDDEVSKQILGTDHYK